MRRLFNLIFQLVAAVVFLFLCTTGWVIYAGLNDQGTQAATALVPGGSDAALDRAVELYNKGQFTAIIVSGSMVPATIEFWGAHSATRGTNTGTADMAKYLESHGVPKSAIFEASPADTTEGTAHEVINTMQTQGFTSVIIVADYYRIALSMLALAHEGMRQIGKAHVGKLDKDDAVKILRQVVAIYHFVGTVYLVPAAEKAKEEAKIGMDKASIDAEKARDSVNKGLNNMSK